MQKYESLKSSDLFEIHESKKKINFVFPHNRELTFEQRESAIDKYYEQEPIRLFEAWKADSRNKDWTGDAEKKKKELFQEKVDQMARSTLVMLEINYPTDRE